ncbi:dipeptide epimerase [Flammeovirga sp. SubArs3]|uniref:dipeptide epimerase n=1 Tax=Flammeovirga sp. SubArs3 TaxID=2995316 RepID=UPI00248CFE3A|nr:dipeptide epimerase [Flammeovirga sp. SubArs3]
MKTDNTKSPIELIYHLYDLKLKETFKIAHDERTVQPTVILEIRYHQYIGFGEAVATKYYQVSQTSICNNIEKALPLLHKWRGEKPDLLFDQLLSITQDTFATCAIDQALWDIYAQLQNKPLYQLWSDVNTALPISNYTIGLDSIPTMKRKLEEFPWPIYKIKLGTEHDLQIISALREVSDVPFRVDANQAWSVQETIDNSSLLKKLGIEFIEQPLGKKNWKGMKVLKGKCALPIIADESCIREQDIDQCMTVFDGVNIKLTKCGGISAALRMIKKAKQYGLLTMLGCMTESSVGITHIAHLCKLVDFVDMDGALLISNDPAIGISWDGYKVRFQNKNGSGISLKS